MMILWSLVRISSGINNFSLICYLLMFVVIVTYCFFFSFPSGHASRAVLILLFFTVLNPVSILFWPPLLAWAVSVAMSRLLLLRHHILDILGGVALAVFEALLLSIIWLEKDTAAWIMSCLSDERLPGYATQEETF